MAFECWARLYCPDVILGVYTPDELEEPQEKIINPVPVQNYREVSEQRTETIEQRIDEAWIDEFRQRVESAATTEETTSLTPRDRGSEKPDRRILCRA